MRKKKTANEVGIINESVVDAGGTKVRVQHVVEDPETFEMPNFQELLQRTREEPLLDVLEESLFLLKLSVSIDVKAKHLLANEIENIVNVASAGPSERTLLNVDDNTQRHWQGALDHFERFMESSIHVAILQLFVEASKVANFGNFANTTEYKQNRSRILGRLEKLNRSLSERACPIFWEGCPMSRNRTPKASARPSWRKSNLQFSNFSLEVKN